MKSLKVKNVPQRHVREMGYPGVEVGRMLNLSGAGVTKSAEKGKKIICEDVGLKRKLIS